MAVSQPVKSVLESPTSKRLLWNAPQNINFRCGTPIYKYLLYSYNPSAPLVHSQRGLCR